MKDRGLEMKTYMLFFPLFFLIIFLMGCEKSTEPISESVNGITLKENAINIATLFVDFETLELEGGNLRSFALDKASDSDSLPFVVSYNEPYDFGSILFQLDRSTDTIFYGTIIWHGRGEIHIPEEILPADSFKKSTSTIKEPLSTKHFEYISLTLLNGLAYDSTFNIEEKGDSAWHVIKNLDITKQFSNQDYRVGIYLYPPSVGAFISSRAKWLIFLYTKLKS
jgi:hypothetical protein